MKKNALICQSARFPFRLVLVHSSMKRILKLSLSLRVRSLIELIFGVRVCGDSMEPVYHDGQIAWIQECSELSPGEVGIFMYDGDGYIKMYDEQEPCEAERYDFTDSDGTLHMQSVLISYNKKYEPKLVSPLARFSIVGRVLN